MALRIYFWIFGAVGLMAIWMDEWWVSVGVGFVMCALGALAATHPTDASDPKRKEYKHAAILLMVSGCVMSLLGLIRKFLLACFIW
jgi:hypothetical protein